MSPYPNSFFMKICFLIRINELTCCRSNTVVIHYRGDAALSAVKQNTADVFPHINPFPDFSISWFNRSYPQRIVTNSSALVG